MSNLNRENNIYVFDKIKSMEEKIDKVIKGMTDMKVDIAGLPQKFFDKADTKYAGKTTEKLVYGMVGTILTSVLGSLLYLVLK